MRNLSTGKTYMEVILILVDFIRTKVKAHTLILTVKGHLHHLTKYDKDKRSPR